MEKLMNHIIFSTCIVLSFSGLIACGEFESDNKNGDSNRIKVSGNNATCGNVSNGNFVDYVNHAGPVIPLSNDHYTNQNDDGAYEFLSYISSDVSCFTRPLQPLQYEFSLNISPVDSGGSPILVLDIIVPHLEKRYHLVSVMGETTYNQYEDGWTEDTIAAEYLFEDGITLFVDMSKSYFGNWKGEVGISYETEMSTNFFIVGSFSASDSTLRN